MIHSPAGWLHPPRHNNSLDTACLPANHHTATGAGLVRPGRL